MIAIADYSPHDTDLIIPPRYWPFLDLDFDSAVASGPTITLRNVRLVIFGDLSENQREITNDNIRWSAEKLRELEKGLTTTDHKQAVEQPTPPPATSRATNAEAESHDAEDASSVVETAPKIPIYTRVYDAWVKLPDDEKSQIHQRGGKKAIARLIHKKMPDVPIQSVERELRRVLRDASGDESRKKAEE